MPFGNYQLIFHRELFAALSDVSIDQYRWPQPSFSTSRITSGRGPYASAPVIILSLSHSGALDFGPFHIRSLPFNTPFGSCVPRCHHLIVLFHVTGALVAVIAAG